MEEFLEINELLERLNSKKHQTIKALSEAFGLNQKRTIKLLNSLLKTEISEKSGVLSADLIPHLAELQALLMKEQSEYGESKKDLEQQKKIKTELKNNRAATRFEKSKEKLNK
ncbi:MAG: hypothetical protein IPM48_03585 [Saprospiraceae bacterium]|nr:hypothetical protein [Saprospiraceae bacterium]